MSESQQSDSQQLESPALPVPTTSISSIPWPALQSRALPVALEPLHQSIEALRRQPSLLAEFNQRWLDLYKEPYTIETYEYALIPCILAQAAVDLPQTERDAACQLLVDWLYDAGLVEDEGQCEFLSACCKHVGPATVPALLDLLEDPFFGSDDCSWFYAWSIAEVVVHSTDEALRDRVAKACMAAVERGMNGSTHDLAATAIITYVLGLLQRTDFLPLLNAAEKRLRGSNSIYETISANEIRHTVGMLEGRGQPHERRDRALDTYAQSEAEDYDKWYRTRGPNWREVAEDQDDFMDQAEPTPWSDRLLDLAARSPFQTNARQVPAPVNSTAFSNKIGRNDPCPCGSGKKYKKCCGNNP